MRQVKHIFDPDNRMNPGKIVDSPAMTDNLRDASLPPAPPLRTALDFTVLAGGSSGMRGAADRCMNIGLCRKTDAGVMCPSYMATRREQGLHPGSGERAGQGAVAADPRTELGETGCTRCSTCA